MSFNAQWDSFELGDLSIPYDRITSELQDVPRFIRGQNTYVTTGGKVIRRPGTLPLNANNDLNLRVDRMWVVETLGNDFVFLFVSAFNPVSGYWEMWFQRQTGSPSAWAIASPGNYRSINNSTEPHEGTVSRGLLYIKGVPAVSTSEKLGSVSFNCTTGSVVVQPWGVLGPSTSCTLANSAIGLVTTSGGITTTATSFTANITAGTVPTGGTQFVIQIDYEQMLVTSSGASGSVTITVVNRAYNGTTLATHAQNVQLYYRNWSASAHNFTVNVGWEYAYAFKSITLQYSNRSPSQTNADALPSNTQPFFNQLPQITGTGLADTTNFPNIGIFRTTDGGGTFFWVADIANPGNTTWTYTDNSIVSTTGRDPLPDTSLDTAVLAPSLTDHSPPPTVVAPLVVGIDAPVQTTPITWFQGRIWYGIQNILFFSAQEEIQIGVPEESWPSGINGNFFRFQYPIVNVKATSSYLYVFTTQATYTISGTNLATFSAQQILDNIGSAIGHPRAIDAFDNAVIFLSHDYRIMLVSDLAQQTPLTLSDPLFTDILNTINGGATVDIKYYGALDKSLIIVAAHNQANPNNSLQFVYDLKKSMAKGPNSLALNSVYGGGKPFWNLPWTYPSTAMIACRNSETSTFRQLILFSWNPSSVRGAFAYLDPTFATYTDSTCNGTLTYNIDMVFCLTRVPPGDHVNQKRVPGITPVIYSIVIDRTSFSGDTDPLFYWFADDLWTTPLPIAVAENPPRRAPSIGYKTMEYPIQQVAQRVAWEITKTNSADNFELQNFMIKYEPEGGA